MVYKRIVITQFGGPDVLQMHEEAELPEPKADEVRIRVLAAGVSFTDTLIRTGTYPDLKDKPPLTPGYDLVGQVDRLGADVSGWSVGDHVADLTVIGAYTEYICLPAQNLVRVPDSVTPEAAVSLVLSGLTAYQLLHRKARAKPGQKILIHGAGGAVGVNLMQLGQLMDLEMYATGSPAKQALIKSYGAIPIDYTSEDFVARIEVLTADGVDAVFDGIGMANFNRSFKTLRKQGKLIIYGALTMNMNSWSERFGAVMGLLSLYWKKLWAPSRSIDGYSIVPFRQKNPEWYQQDLAALFELLAEGKLSPKIDLCLPLEEVAQAHVLIENAKVQGRIVLSLIAAPPSPSDSV